MKNSRVEVPEIIKNLNPVTEQSGPLWQDTGRMRIPASVPDIARTAYELLTRSEQEICDAATD